LVLLFRRNSGAYKRARTACLKSTGQRIGGTHLLNADFNLHILVLECCLFLIKKIRQLKYQKIWDKSMKLHRVSISAWLSRSLLAFTAKETIRTKACCRDQVRCKPKLSSLTCKENRTPCIVPNPSTSFIIIRAFVSLWTLNIYPMQSILKGQICVKSSLACWAWGDHITKWQTIRDTPGCTAGSSISESQSIKAHMLPFGQRSAKWKLSVTWVSLLLPFMHFSM